MSIDASQAGLPNSQSCTLYVATNKRGVEYFHKNFDTSVNGLFIAKGDITKIIHGLKILLGLIRDKPFNMRYEKIVFLYNSEAGEGNRDIGALWSSLRVDHFQIYDNVSKVYI